MTVNLLPRFADEDPEPFVFILPWSLPDKEHIPLRSIGWDAVVDAGAESAAVRQSSNPSL